MSETSFLDDVRADVEVKGPPCTIGRLLETAPFAADLSTALATREIKSAAIARVLQQRGCRMGEYTISRHRRGLCRCAS